MSKRAFHVAFADDEVEIQLEDQKTVQDLILRFKDILAPKFNDISIADIVLTEKDQTVPLLLKQKLAGVKSQLTLRREPCMHLCSAPPFHEFIHLQVLLISVSSKIGAHFQTIHLRSSPSYWGNQAFFLLHQGRKVVKKKPGPNYGLMKLASRSLKCGTKKQILMVPSEFHLWP